MEFLQPGGNISSRRGPCLLPPDTMTAYWPATAPPLPQGISPGLTSWGRLSQAALEVESCGVPVSTGLLPHCSSVISVYVHPLVMFQSTWWWEAGSEAAPSIPTLCFLFSPVPGSFMALAALSFVWFWKSTWHHVNVLLFHFPTLTGCAGLAITGCVGAAVTPHSVTQPTFPLTGGAGCLASPSPSLALLLMSLFVEKVDFLPRVWHSVLDIFVPMFSELLLTVACWKSQAFEFQLLTSPPHSPRLIFCANALSLW